MRPGRVVVEAARAGLTAEHAMPSSGTGPSEVHGRSIGRPAARTMSPLPRSRIPRRVWRGLLAPAAADPAFHDRVHSRRLNSGADDPGASGLEDGVERGGETAVAVMQDELYAHPCIVQVHQQVPGLLHYPPIGHYGASPGGRTGPGATIAPSGGGRCPGASERSCWERRSIASPPGALLAPSPRAAPATPGPAMSDANERGAARAGPQRADAAA